MKITKFIINALLLLYTYLIGVYVYELIFGFDRESASFTFFGLSLYFLLIFGFVHLLFSGIYKYKYQINYKIELYDPKIYLSVFILGVLLPFIIR